MLMQLTSRSVGIALDFVSNCYWFETHWSHCGVSLRKTHYPVLSTDSNKEDKKSFRNY